MDHETNQIDELTTEFLRQWKQVILKHPLIAASIMMQDQSFAKVVSQRLPPAPVNWISAEYRADVLAKAFGDSATVTTVGERLVHAFRELWRDLGRATSDDETAAAFGRFGRLWAGDDDKVVPRTCPDCDGTGKIGSDDCSRCRGTGQIW